MLACPDCRATALSIHEKAENIRCTSCGHDFEVVSGIPVLFKNGHPSHSVEHLIEINTDDLPVFKGEDFYIQAGHAQHLLAGIGARPGEWVLDLGCGHGHVSKWILENSSAQVVSYDILLPVLSQVENPLVICGSADNLVFRDGSFDRIVFTDVLEHIPPEMQDTVIAEIYRVLKHGGTVYVDYPGNKLPYYTGYNLANVLIAFLKLMGKRMEYHTLSREPEAHVNLSFPHLVNRSFHRCGFVGKVIPLTTKFFSIPGRYKTFVKWLNVFPLNYFFCQQLIGSFRKPPACFKESNDAKRL
jgi:ubiquinone/menaquinone biosynthesis C-methylase UbiE/uncharacterized protein YbaR (Trm112 family)